MGGADAARRAGIGGLRPDIGRRGPVLVGAVPLDGQSVVRACQQGLRCVLAEACGNGQVVRVRTARRHARGHGVLPDEGARRHHIEAAVGQEVRRFQ